MIISSGFLQSPAAPPSSQLSGIHVGKEKGEQKYLSRREFVERAVILGSSLLLTVVSAGAVISGLFQQSVLSSPSGGAIDLQDAPAIFSDPRLQSLVSSEVTSNGSFYRVGD